MQPAKKTPIKLLKLFVSLCFVVLSPSLSDSPPLHGICTSQRSLVSSVHSLFLSLSSGFPPPATWRCGGRPVKHRGLLHAEHQPSFLPGVHQEPQPVLEGGLRRQPVPGTRGETGQSTTPRASHLIYCHTIRTVRRYPQCLKDFLSLFSLKVQMQM